MTYEAVTHGDQTYCLECLPAGLRQQATPIFAYRRAPRCAGKLLHTYVSFVECAFCGVPDRELFVRIDGLPVCGHCRDWEFGEPIASQSATTANRRN
jgi:hypothetical protein